LASALCEPVDAHFTGLLMVIGGGTTAHNRPVMVGAFPAAKKKKWIKRTFAAFTPV